MARITSRKDPLASFIWTMGAADMVIGGVGERGSLFTLGLLTVGAGLLLRWLRQQRQGRKYSLRSGRQSLSGVLPSSGKALSAMTRDVSALVARQLRSSSIRSSKHGRGSRSRDGYSSTTRPGFRANNFVNAGQSRSGQTSPGQATPGQARPVTARYRRRPAAGQYSAVQPSVTPPSGNDSSGSMDETQAALDGAANSGVRPAGRPAQGPPLNLPPAPRSRTRRGRRIY